MDQRLEKLILKIVKASKLNKTEKNELHNELSSHVTDQIHDLKLQGFSEERCARYVLSHFGNGVLIGNGILMAHSKPSFIFISEFSQFLSLTNAFMKKQPQKILSILVLIILIWVNYLFLSQYFVFKTQGPLMMKNAIDATVYDLDAFYQREDGTYEDSGEKKEISLDDVGHVNHAFNPDLDEDGKLTIREAHTYQVISQISNIEAAGSNIAGNSVTLLGYLLILVDAIGLGFVVRPWLKS